MIPLIRTLNGTLDRIPHDMVALALRVFPALVFWQSGRTKVDGLLTLSPSTHYLFAEEYHVPLLPPDVAVVATRSSRPARPAPSKLRR